MSKPVKNPPSVPSVSLRAKPTHAEVIDVITASEGFKVAQQERDAKLLARRQAVGRELAELDGPRAAEFQKGQAELDAATAELATAHRTVVAAANKLSDARMKATQSSFAHVAERDRIEAELKATCHPAIAPFIAEMNGLWGDVRRYRAPLPSVSRNAIGERIVKSVDVQSAALARITAIREAIGTAEELRLMADQSSVPARLEDLRRKIPSMPGMEASK